HAEGGGAVTLGGVEDEAAPAAADVEEAVSPLEPELAADEVELALLRRREVVVLRLEVRARIDEPRVEERGKELVRAPVVEVDGGAVALDRVPPPTESRPRLARPLAPRGRQCTQLTGQRELRRPAPRLGEQEVGQREDRLEVAL